MDLIVDPDDIVQCRTALRGGTESGAPNDSIDLWTIQGGQTLKKKSAMKRRRNKAARRSKSKKGLLAGSRLWRVKSSSKRKSPRNKRKLYEMRRSRSRIYRSRVRRRSA